MELVGVREYHGFKTEFFILSKTKKFLVDHSVNVRDHLMDDFHWYEHIIFDLLDQNPDRNWSEKKETRRNFKVVFYGVIEKLTEEGSEGFVEVFDFDESNVLNDRHFSIHPKNKNSFAVREKILVNDPS